MNAAASSISWACLQIGLKKILRAYGFWVSAYAAQHEQGSPSDNKVRALYMFKVQSTSSQLASSTPFSQTSDDSPTVRVAGACHF